MIIKNYDWVELKILTSLAGISNMCYNKFDKYLLVSYWNADYFGDRIERKNTSDGCPFTGENLIDVLD